MVVARRVPQDESSGMTRTNHDLRRATVCVVGLGYVGLPLAEAFSRKLRVIGFDVNAGKIDQLRQRNGDADQGMLNAGPDASVHSSPASVTLTSDPVHISEADFVIICVPTPVSKSKEPDLSFVENAAVTVSQNMKKGSTVVLESTVYPGATEEFVKPILERAGFKCGRDFRLAYSSERVNPADDEHAIGTVTKVVSGMDEETTDLVARLYRMVAPSVFRAKSIRAAEASKLVENIQRDMNIAVINELAVMFTKMGLRTRDVLEAAETKWNFHRYTPGMVGGHCIAVDPYYLVHKAKESGHLSNLILAGRGTNDYMPTYIAGLALDGLETVGKMPAGSRALVVGLTYKENVADTREAPAETLIAELMQRGVEVFAYDPLVEGVAHRFHAHEVDSIHDVSELDCIIVTLVHDCMKWLTLETLEGCCNGTPVLIDVRGFFDREEAVHKGFHYRTL